MNLKHAILDKITTMKDGSLKITLVTQELQPKDIAELFMQVNKEIVSIDLPVDIQEEPKSKSQRLRNTLYVLWQQEHKAKYDTFELFYNSYMEKLINSLKDKLI